MATRGDRRRWRGGVVGAGKWAVALAVMLSRREIGRRDDNRHRGDAKFAGTLNHEVHFVVWDG